MYCHLYAGLLYAIYVYIHINTYVCICSTQALLCFFVCVPKNGGILVYPLYETNIEFMCKYLLL